MAKATLKTKKTEVSPKKFLETIIDKQKQKDCASIMEMMQKASGEEPKMWGASIVGFGNVSLKYESGRELDWFKFGFSPRKQNITLYGVIDPEKDKAILDKMGKYTTGKGCLYINSLKEVDTKVLQKIIESASKKKK